MLPLAINPEKLVSLLQFDKASPLLFNSGLFLLLFCGFILIYQLMRKYHYAKMIFVILFRCTSTISHPQNTVSFFSGSA